MNLSPTNHTYIIINWGCAFIIRCFFTVFGDFGSWGSECHIFFILLNKKTLETVEGLLCTLFQTHVKSPKTKNSCSTYCLIRTNCYIGFGSFTLDLVPRLGSRLYVLATCLTLASGLIHRVL